MVTAAAYGRASPPVVAPESSIGLPPREYAHRPRTPGVVAAGRERRRLGGEVHAWLPGQNQTLCGLPLSTNPRP
ncbi:hypothetical protein NMK34_01440 [Micromonospora sp. BRA006-A]|uniref:hypothetical protein n=1 Tax=Micromonospora sp. BRA006-A TaxID=2962860 RepID=UPI00296F583B|nr:hypothetical protein [Micromonospora sp. BRA006-A]MDW3845266.1 hypothetical protein [Micromonospora sp. BRA006-A]